MKLHTLILGLCSASALAFAAQAEINHHRHGQ